MKRAFFWLLYLLLLVPMIVALVVLSVLAEIGMDVDSKGLWVCEAMDCLLDRAQGRKGP